MRFLSLVWVLFLATTSLAQIKIDERVSPFKPIWAQCEIEAEGEGVESQIEWSISDGAYVVGSGPRVNVYGKIGPHRIEATVFSIWFETFKDADGKERRALKRWKFKKYSAKFDIVANPDEKPDDPPKPNPKPNPKPKPTGFEATIAAGLETVPDEHRSAKSKVAGVYSQVAGEAEADSDIDVQKMQSIAKTRITSTLSPAEISAWSKFWAFQAKAFNELKMSSKTDLVAAYRRLYTTLAESE